MNDFVNNSWKKNKSFWFLFIPLYFVFLLCFLTDLQCHINDNLASVLLLPVTFYEMGNRLVQKLYIPCVLKADCIKMLTALNLLCYSHSKAPQRNSCRLPTSVLQQWQKTVMQHCYYWKSPGQFTATRLINALEPKRGYLHKSVAHVRLQERVYSKLSKDTGDYQAHSSAFSGNGWQSKLVSMTSHSLHALFIQTHHKASMIIVYVLACLVVKLKCHSLFRALACLIRQTLCINMDIQ